MYILISNAKKFCFELIRNKKHRGTCISRFRVTSSSIRSVRREDDDEGGKMPAGRDDKHILLCNSVIGQPPTNHVRSVVPEILL